MGHARAIATADPEALANEIVEGDLSVRQAEHLAKKVRPCPGSDIGRASARNALRPVDADLPRSSASSAICSGSVSR